MRRRAFLGSMAALPLVSWAEPVAYPRVTPGKSFAFPRDHGAHPEFRTEWWYSTGNLTTKEGRAFGYQLTFFRRGMPLQQVETLPSRWSIMQLYLAHFGGPLWDEWRSRDAKFCDGNTVISEVE